MEERHQSDETVVTFLSGVTHSHLCQAVKKKKKALCFARFLPLLYLAGLCQIAVSVFSQQMVYKLIANKVLAITKSTQNAKKSNRSPVSSVCAEKDINLSSAEQTPK